MNKSYNELVATCKLLDYREELAGKYSVWKECWQDADRVYISMFTEYQTSPIPHTIYTRHT